MTHSNKTKNSSKKNISLNILKTFILFAIGFSIMFYHSVGSVKDLLGLIILPTLFASFAISGITGLIELSKKKK